MIQLNRERLIEEQFVILFTYSFEKITFRNKIKSSSRTILHRFFNKINIQLIHRTIRCQKTNKCCPIILFNRTQKESSMRIFVRLTSLTEVVVTVVSQVVTAPPLAVFGLFVRGLFVPFGGILYPISYYKSKDENHLILNVIIFYSISWKTISTNMIY